MSTSVAPTVPVHDLLRARRRRVRRTIGIAGALSLIAAVLFLVWGIPAGWDIILPMRVSRLVGLAIVAVSLSAATVVFQAVTRNRILSPSVMGFDAMYSLTATVLVFTLTSNVVNHIPALALFGIQVALQTALALGMFMLILTRARASVHLLVLIGLVIGTLLRSITSMLSLVMDPNEFLAVADRQIASFAVINEESLLVALVVSVIVLALIWWRAPVWDIVALGPALSTSLGVPYRREARLALAASSILVACATALVGPLMFFGLLIVNIAIFACATTRMRHLLLVSSLIGVAVLVGGQWLLEHVFDHGTVLPVMIELVGGLALLFLIVKESRR